jgi:hypothetical protein
MLEIKTKRFFIIMVLPCIQRQNTLFADRQHPNQPELFQHEQPYQNNQDDKLDSLLTNSLKKAPEQTLKGF